MSREQPMFQHQLRLLHPWVNLPKDNSAQKYAGLPQATLTRSGVKFDLSNTAFCIWISDVFVWPELQAHQSVSTSDIIAISVGVPGTLVALGTMLWYIRRWITQRRRGAASIKSVTSDDAATNNNNAASNNSSANNDDDRPPRGRVRINQVVSFDLSSDG
ncbi:hypothetical protein QBC44DRAFT_309011 [Cladorrhinum sp. PSN332]|nr:hypothetical protein QBC44DRAFT_309011 [Cladorrhinum sp. PSN332]